MIKKIIPVMAIIAVLATACAAEPAVPTMSPEEVQGTAIAGALTIVAETQAAIPTATPLPPTETPSPTPLPTFTLEPSPTVDFSVIPTATQAPSTTSGNPCDGLLNVAEAGPQSNIRLVNETTKGTVSVSLKLTTQNAFAQCGSLPTNPITLAPKGSTTISIPKGDYFVYALITYPDGRNVSATGYFLNKVADDHLFRVIINDVNVVNKQ